jgi:hypothetical protein
MSCQERTLTRSSGATADLAITAAPATVASWKPEICARVHKMLAVGSRKRTACCLSLWKISGTNRGFDTTGSAGMLMDVDQAFDNEALRMAGDPARDPLLTNCTA